MEKKFDFCGWATRNNLKCTDGRIIMKDAFAHCDGMTVPLVWNHQHNDVSNVLGHAVLENRKDGVYTYGYLNDSPQGKIAKELLEHGDISALSIHANGLKQQGSNVMHGNIREVSLVLAGANPGAFIESISSLNHSEDSDEEGVIYTGEEITLYHAEEEESANQMDEENIEGEEESVEHADNEGEETVADIVETMNEKQKTVLYALIGHAVSGGSEEESVEHADNEGEETVEDVINSMNEKQKTVLYALVGQAVKETENDSDDNNEDSEGGNKTMKHNVFDKETENNKNVLSHSDEANIIAMAKSSSVGSLQDAIGIYCEQNETLNHAFVNAEGAEAIDTLFPEYKDVRPGAPEFIQRDQGWVTAVMNGTHKSPISRIRTRQADITGADLRAHGYKKGDEKKVGGNIKLLSRTTDPQTIYRKDVLHRDDILDITDFDVANYLYQVMRQNLNEDIAMAIMVGDRREDGDTSKIDEAHVRSIWHDDELYTIHKDVDIEAAKAELQGTDTAVHFGDNYIYAEAIITALLYAREQYKGSGNADFYCTPHLLNVMLLARDLNGRRMYASKAELTAALNVRAIHTAEQYEGLTRTTADGKTKELLGIFVNLADYQVGATKGGEITRFNQFDIDFNQEKYLIETRISGALTRVKSAIVLEKPVEVAAG